MALGHTRERCPSIVDRSGCCFNYGCDTHRRKECRNKPSCPVCQEREPTHDHSPGGKGCKPVPPKNMQRGSPERRTPPAFRPEASQNRGGPVREKGNKTRVECEENRKGEISLTSPKDGNKQGMERPMAKRRPRKVGSVSELETYKSPIEDTPPPLEEKIEKMAEEGFSTPTSRNFEGLISSSPKGEKSKENVGEVNLEKIKTLIEMSRQKEEYPPDGEKFMETSPETKVTSKEARRTSKDNDSDL